ncbi:hypothetical protein [Geoglobus acetivorans]|uniref:Uncharacterized protein n=1 Tax=Geoglobus acetivorans TaxID=565033 RepID=A0A0A7GG20_GEOAI|nr:hypothetical protein GACE_0848 [Geoglobus acetivorans]
MMLNVFDDRRGTVFHVAAGGLTYIFPTMFVIFFAYEFVEHIYLKGAEREVNFLGDVFEFSFGVMLMLLLAKMLGCAGMILFAVFLIVLWILMGRWDHELRKNTRE